MSIIQTISSLYNNPSSLQFTTLLSFEQHEFCNSLSEDLDSIIRSNSRKNSEVKGRLMKTMRINLDDLHLKVRVETEDGRKLVDNCMPPPMEMMYRQTTISSLLKRQNHFSEQEMDCPLRRDSLVLYVLQLHTKSNFKIETLHQAISIIDGYFCRKSINQEKDRLLGTAALWIARKLEETKMQRLSSWLKIVGGYSCEDIIQMESDILECYGFEIVYPTAYSFLEIIATYFALNYRTLTLCSYLLELTLLDSKYLGYKRSLLAVSSLYLGFKILDPEQWNPVVLDVLNITEDELIECSHELLKALQLMQKNQKGDTYQKYSKGEFYRIAKIRFWPPIS